MATDLPPSEYFSGIVFNPANYTAGTDALTLEYALENFLPSQGVAISYANTNFTAPVAIADATITTSLKLPNTITGNDGATCTAFASNTALGLDTFTMGNSIASQDLKTINLNCATTLNLGLSVIGASPNINISNANKNITISSRGTVNNISIGAGDNSAICPVNINTTGAANTALTTIGTSLSGVNIVGSSTIGTTTSNSCTLNANVGGSCAIMNLPSATITAASFVGDLIGQADVALLADTITVTGASTGTYYLTGSTASSTGNYALQTDSGGHASFSSGTNILAVGGVTNGSVSITGTASSISVAGTGTAISCPNATVVSLPLANVTATTFTGALTGTASSATNATNTVNTGVTAVSTVYSMVGSSSASTGTYALQTTSSGNFSFTPSTQTMLIGGGTNGNISVIGTASSIQVAGTGTAISAPNAALISFPSADVTALSYAGCLKSPTSASSGTSTLAVGVLTFTPDTSPSALSSIMQFSLNVTSTITLTSFSVTSIRNNTTFSFVVTTGPGAIFTIPTGLANCKINVSTAIPANSYGLFQVSYLANSAGVYFYFIESFGVFI